MSRDRDASARVLAEHLADVGVVSRRVLLAGGSAELPNEIADLGAASVEVWHRTARGGRTAAPWPGMGPFDDVALRLPVGKESLKLLVSECARRLAPGGRLWVHGANDEGIKSAESALSDIFERVSSVASKRHARVWRAEGLRAAPAPAEPTRVDAVIAGVALSFLSWPGLFAHGRVDAATEALLGALPRFDGRVLDFGCGAGVIGQFLQRRDGLLADLSDVDALAVDVARANVPGAAVHLADGLPEGTGRYRAIVSNPPLHLGKDLEPGLLRTLVEAAPKRLGRSGELWITTQGAVPLRALLEEHFGAVQLVVRDKRFTVWRAIR